MWIVWDKKSDINGLPADRFLSRHKCLANQEIIYLLIIAGRVARVEGKSILARVYNLDPALPDDEFLAAYEAKLAELEEQARLEAPDEPIEEPEPEPEPDETATYAELAQVYKEGVNGLE